MSDGPAFSLPARSRQQAIGLTLAVLIAGAWLGIHAYAMFVFELSWQNLPFALLLATVQTWLSVGVFIVSHDAMHGSLAPGRPTLNSAIGAFLLALYAGFGWRRMRDAHFTHHKLAGHAGDPDFDEHNPRSFWRWYGTFFRRYFSWQSILFVHVVVGIYWLVLDIPMVQIVLLYGAPALLSSLQLFYFGTFRPHRRSEEGFADRHNARSDGFGTLASLATCFHFGYHLEHHRRPDVPWWALPGAREAGIGMEAQNA
ncbi:fatty acid desaturase [Erythrobacter litoralis]|uniref:Beta-carotene ketolase n=1 Tax=Erythrobacter litoralis (strain HTCC2594) TaxID=314225 RepID=Q2NC35_ERYLH|nr:fatty acid desaturase [Erythrobacter litoralis]ABC62756.1 beta-carotene ketolase [Erythrobacter litoralis HTCC2594]